MGAFDCDCIENLMGRFDEERKIETELNNSTDTISRQAAIDTISIHLNKTDVPVSYPGISKALEEWLNDLPPVQPEPNWIPCSERLPEDEYVLISKKPTKLSGIKWCVTIATRTADPRSGKIKWRDIGFGTIREKDVLAWMPLPKPYREEGD